MEQAQSNENAVKKESFVFSQQISSNHAVMHAMHAVQQSCFEQDAETEPATPCTPPIYQMFRFPRPQIVGHSVVAWPMDQFEPTGHSRLTRVGSFDQTNTFYVPRRLRKHNGRTRSQSV